MTLADAYVNWNKADMARLSGLVLLCWSKQDYALVAI